MVKNLLANAEDSIGHGFDPWSRKIARDTGQLSPCATTIKLTGDNY